jgi:hypothetical protein
MAHTGLLDEATDIHAAYGLFTSTDYLIGDSEASLEPRWVNVPAWIVTFAGVPLSVYGPPPGVAPTQGPPLIGEMDVIVDAVTGAYMYSLASNLVGAFQLGGQIIGRSE